MKFSLRSLMALMTIAPAILAGLWFAGSWLGSTELILIFAVASAIGIVASRMIDAAADRIEGRIKRQKMNIDSRPSQKQGARHG